MKKKNLKSLKLNKKSISNFNSQTDIKGGVSGANTACDCVRHTDQTDCVPIHSIICFTENLACLVTKTLCTHTMFC